MAFLCGPPPQYPLKRRDLLNNPIFYLPACSQGSVLGSSIFTHPTICAFVHSFILLHSLICSFIRSRLVRPLADSACAGQRRPRSTKPGVFAFSFVPAEEPRGHGAMGTDWAAGERAAGSGRTGGGRTGRGWQEKLQPGCPAQPASLQGTMPGGPSPGPAARWQWGHSEVNSRTRLMKSQGLWAARQNLSSLEALTHGRQREAGRG